MRHCMVRGYRSSRSRLNQSTNERSAFLPELSHEERLIYTELKNETLHIDEITKLTGIASSKALAILLSLELSGLVTQLPGKMFQIKKTI